MIGLRTLLQALRTQLSLLQFCELLDKFLISGHALQTHMTPRMTPQALGSSCIDRGYYKCWMGLKSHFQNTVKPEEPSKDGP